jgi:plastocyanin
MIDRMTMNNFPKNWLDLPRRLLLLSLAALIAIVIGVVLILHALFPSTTVIKAAPIAVIEISPSGFIPSTLAVNAGTKVVWVNYDQLPHQIAADPYPTHSELPALVAPKALGYKQTYSFIFTKTGTIHFYDELNPTWQGTVEIAK